MIVDVKAFCVFPFNSSLKRLPASYSSTFPALFSVFPIYYFPPHVILRSKSHFKVAPTGL